MPVPLERQRASGLSITGFCQKVCRRSRFTPGSESWRPARQAQRSAAKAVSRSQQVEHSGATQPRRSACSSRADAGTMPRTASFLQRPIVGARVEPRVELTLVDGILVRIPAQNLAALQMVFTILRGGEMPATIGEVQHA